MSKKTEMINIIKAELTLLAKKILENIHRADVEELYEVSRTLYEKSSALKHLSLFLDEETEKENISDTKPNLSQINSHKTKFSEDKTGKTKKVSDANELKKDVFKKVSGMKFVSKENKVTSSLPRKKMNIGLNDKISFIKHLFDGDVKMYTETINQLNNIDNYEEALSYLYNEVKPQFNDWRNAEEYEFRLIQLLELKFN